MSTKLLALFVFLIPLAQATTVYIEFDYSIYENQTLQNLTGNYSLYLQNKTAPAYVVTGYNLRVEDFLLLGKDHMKTYNVSGKEVVVLELGAWNQQQVNSQTKSIQDRIDDIAKEKETLKAQLGTAQEMSSPAACGMLYLTLGGVTILVIIVVTLVGIKFYMDKRGQPISRRIESPYDKRKAITRPDEIDEAFIEMGEGRYPYANY